MGFRSLACLWVALCVCILLLTASDVPFEADKYDLVAPIRGDRSVERTRVEPEFEKIATLSSGDNYTIYDPSTVEISDAGTVYVIDAGDFTVKSFTPEGEHLATFDGGRGRGPGQLLSYTDIGVWNDSLLYVADPRQRRVSFYEKDGTFSRAENYDGVGSYRVAWARDGTHYVVCEFLLPTQPFMRIITPDRQLDITRRPSRSAAPIIQDGYVRALDERAIYVPKHLPVLLTYSPEDTTGVATPTPDYGKDLPAPREGGGAPSGFTNGRPTLSGGVLSVQIPTEAQGVGFDLYDANTMKYMHTVDVPVEDAEAWYAHAHNLVATSRDTTVNLYRVAPSRK